MYTVFEATHRGYSIIQDEYVYGYLYVAEDKNGKQQSQILVPDYFVGNSKSYVVAPETVEMYTGRHDKNGVSIFEGDVVNAKITEEIPVAPEQQTFEVKIKKSCCRLVNKTTDIPISYAEEIEIVASHGKKERKINV